MEERHTSDFAKNFLAWMNSGKSPALTYGSEPLKGAKRKIKEPIYKEWRRVGHARKLVHLKKPSSSSHLEREKVFKMTAPQLASALDHVAGESQKRARKTAIKLWLSVPGNTAELLTEARAARHRQEKTARKQANRTILDSYTKEALRAMPYPEFLESDYWRTVRKIVLSRDKHRCTDCATDRNLQVHHLSYRHHGAEHRNLKDLVTLCRPCHEKRHTQGQSERHAA